MIISRAETDSTYSGPSDLALAEISSALEGLTPAQTREVAELRELIASENGSADRIDELCARLGITIS